MRLTRRDALHALVMGGGIGVGAAAYADRGATGNASAEKETGFSTDQLQTVVAIAEVVYPTEVTGIPEFAEQYVTGLPSDKQADLLPVIDAFSSHIRDVHDRPFWELSIPNRNVALQELGVDRMSPDPTGTLPERVRYHLINQLLYGLFTVPKGSELVGIENPVGYPGGYQSYQTEPDATE
jgi:hypothetical protein